ncbi:MAG TPA: translation initiation factor IF-2, partial [Acidobacteriota bacterium]|nr:translation initiation factor IF-2 [Acidobacteriota bacterium]
AVLEEVETPADAAGQETPATITIDEKQPEEIAVAKEEVLVNEPSVTPAAILTGQETIKVDTKSLKPAPAPPEPIKKTAQPSGGIPPGGIKIVPITKLKPRVLVRTTTEKTTTGGENIPIVFPTKTTGLKPTFIQKPLRKKKPERGERPERLIKPVELPRPPASPEDYKPITMTEGVTIKEIAAKMDIKSKYVIQKLLAKGILASINQALDIEAAKEVCAEFGFRAGVISFEEEAEAGQEVPDKQEDHETRPPVVTIMGHVDHGKTSLLDVIRVTKVSETEAGGITQHIGAYQVGIRNRSIVFLDTPGHEAFTMMRSRGAQVTDIVVLVVAADDGVMPQTIEAIHHAKAANVPIIVAINKIDKPGAQIDRVKQALADQSLLAEDWGGDVVTVPVSAKQNTNIDLLLEMILLVADMKELKANPKRLASGVVLEAKVDRGRGCVATVLVQNGTLRLGDSVVAGSGHGRVRAIINDRGDTLNSAGPSVPVEIQGLQELPMAGDIFQVFDDATKARQVAEYRQAKARELALNKTVRLSLDALFEKMREGTVK